VREVAEVHTKSGMFAAAPIPFAATEIAAPIGRARAILVEYLGGVDSGHRRRADRRRQTSFTCPARGAWRRGARLRLGYVHRCHRWAWAATPLGIWDLVVLCKCSAIMNSTRAYRSLSLAPGHRRYAAGSALVSVPRGLPTGLPRVGKSHRTMALPFQSGPTSHTLGPTFLRQSPITGG